MIFRGILTINCFTTDLVPDLLRQFFKVLALCIHQLQTSSVDETLEQDQEQFRDQSLRKRWEILDGNGKKYEKLGEHS